LGNIVFSLKIFIISNVKRAILVIGFTILIMSFPCPSTLANLTNQENNFNIAIFEIHILPDKEIFIFAVSLEKFPKFLKSFLTPNKL